MSSFTALSENKLSWNKCDGCKLECNEYKVDWSRTKYGGRRGNENTPKDHTLSNIQDKFISGSNKPTTIPGIVANEIFELAYDNQNKKYNFTPNLEYDSDEIFEMCGGVLWGISERTENTIEVTYMAYDHHNEPIETINFSLVPIINTT